MWIETSGGLVNLDHVQRVQTASDGTTRLYFTATTFESVTSVGQTYQEAYELFSKLVCAVDPAA